MHCLSQPVKPFQLTYMHAPRLAGDFPLYLVDIQFSKKICTHYANTTSISFQTADLRRIVIYKRPLIYFFFRKPFESSLVSFIMSYRSTSSSSPEMKALRNMYSLCDGDVTSLHPPTSDDVFQTTAADVGKLNPTNFFLNGKKMMIHVRTSSMKSII